jgi:PPOX class probable F420-dependent enzyme
MPSMPRRPALDAREPPGDAAAFIAAARVARLGTADADGRPLVVPVCYAFDGRYWYSAVDTKPKRTPARALQRVRNIRANPWVSVLIDYYDEDWSRLRWVIIHGRAELLRPGREHTRARALLTAKYPQYAALRLPPNGAVIRVTPTSYILWKYAA